jgi:protein-S-isoprenylcysteine O-methyltransferase Ste14
MWHTLPLAGILSIVLIALGLRPWLQRRRHGISGVLLFRSGRRGQSWRDAALVVLMALLTGQALVAALGRDVPHLLPGGSGAFRAALQVAGAALLAGGVALLAAAQLNMGASWRIGIVEGEAPGLVTGGLYRCCRHPIYLGLLMALAGYTALLPTPLSLALLAAAYVGVRIQAAAEETYLARTYGAAYHAYAHRVGRLLPGIGKAPHTIGAPEIDKCGS